MAIPRRRSGYNYVDAVNASSHGHPETVYPPEGYYLIETDLHRATTPFQVASFPFLSQLKLRSVINLSAEPLHEHAVDFFRRNGVTMLAPQSLEAIDGPYDLWEEAAKESLELVLDANNQPMILLDSPTECESACLVGCLRRLQHWSVCAIHDEYQMMTMRNTIYDTNQRFIERFDLDLVTLGANLPRWYREHIAMLEEERVAEEELERKHPDRPAQAWTYGFCPSERAGGASIQQGPAAEKRGEQLGETQDGVEDTAGSGKREEKSTSLDVDKKEGDGRERHGQCPMGQVGQEERDEGPGSPEGGSQACTGGEGNGAGMTGTVPDYRLNGFVYVCPLVSVGCKFTAKAWLQDEDD